MPLSTEDRARVQDMLDAARLVVSFVAGHSFDEYDHDVLLRSAVERQIEIVGEAARSVSDEAVNENPYVQWRAIRAQRHVLAHDYGRIDNIRVWRVASVHVPELIRQLESLLA